MQSYYAPPFEVVRADALGLCFGVRDALEVAFTLQRPEEVTLHGELVHNTDVQRALATRGFESVPEDRRGGSPNTPRVLITAHGVSDAERTRLRVAGKELIDTTCPLVVRAHEAAKRLERAGYFVIVIGRAGHVEVRGLVGDLKHYEIVGCAQEARAYPGERLGIVCQTTMPERTVREVRDALWTANPDAELRFVDTVCQPTKDRQRAIDRLIRSVDLVVVVGGRHSNNTLELFASCLAGGVDAFHVERAEELEERWFHGCRRVGLTAGTSTPDETIDAVHARLLKLAVRRRRPGAA